jgi:hypothetical protein
MSAAPASLGALGAELLEAIAALLSGADAKAARAACKSLLRAVDAGVSTIRLPYEASPPPSASRASHLQAGPPHGLSHLQRRAPRWPRVRRLEIAVVDVPPGTRDILDDLKRWAPPRAPAAKRPRRPRGRAWFCPRAARRAAPRRAVMRPACDHPPPLARGPQGVAAV